MNTHSLRRLIPFAALVALSCATSIQSAEQWVTLEDYQDWYNLWLKGRLNEDIRWNVEKGVWEGILAPAESAKRNAITQLQAVGANSSPRAAGQAGAAALMVDSGRFELNGSSGRIVSLPLSTEFTLNDKVSLGFVVPVSYLEIEGDTSWGTGLAVNLPVKVLSSKPNTSGSAFNWTIIPAIGANATSSDDLQMGGVMATTGVSSIAEWKLKSLSITLGNQWSYYGSTSMKFAGYRYEEEISQHLYRNGLKVAFPLSDKLSADTYVMRTDLVGSQVLSGFMSYGADLSYRLPSPKNKSDQPGFLTAGVRVDKGPQFKAANIQLGSGWRF